MTPARDVRDSPPSIWFHTGEWERAADWDMPQAWAELPPAPAEPPAERVFPRRRDLRAALAELELELAVDAALAETIAASLAAPVAGTLAAAPAPVVYPRRRDLRRAEQTRTEQARIARHGTPVAPPVEPIAQPTTEPQPATEPQPIAEPIASPLRLVARAGVVALMVAATTASVAGSTGLDLSRFTFGEGRDITAAQVRDALTLAPIPGSSPGAVTEAVGGAAPAAQARLQVWDFAADTPYTDKGALSIAAARQKASDARQEAAAAAAKAAAERAAAQKRAAAAKKKAEAAAAAARAADRAEAVRSAQRNPKAIAQIMVAERGWSSTQWVCLDRLWTRESNWRWYADNPTSSAYGIPQALPGRKMASAGSDWATNPVTQIRWGLGYIADRYGTPCSAWAHSERVGWY